jgi:hypothetical protein
VPVSLFDTLGAGCDPFAVNEMGPGQSNFGAYQNRHNPLQTGKNRCR